MFCPKCGCQLPDDSRFCSSCGANLGDMVMSEQQAFNPEQQAFNPEQQMFNPEQQAFNPEQQVFNPEQQTVQQDGNFQNPENPAGAEFVKPKKKVSSKMIAGIAVAAALVTGGTLALRSGVLSSLSNDNVYACLSDGSYEMITNLKKGKSLEIDSSRLSLRYSVSEDILSFSPDGKYVYYYTRFDSDYGTGTLCRAEYKKLKEDSSKNEKYIETIATDVIVGFEFLNDGSVLYRNSDHTLYLFDGEEEIRIAKDVNYYYTDYADRLIYETGDYSDGYVLYGVKFSDVENKIKLASNYYSICNAYTDEDFDIDNILYSKYEDDGSMTLYTVGFEKESEKLCENACILSYKYNDGKTYISAENGTTLSLYDYVDDPYADADAGIKEPKKDNFEIPYYRYDVISSRDVTEDDFEELYTSCTKPLNWYDARGSWFDETMEDALDMDWGDDTEAIHNATQKFIDEFGSKADENGYIAVTPEVKNALMEIQNAYSGEKEDYEWLWLCYNKYESGTTIDYDAYDAAYDKWNEASGRISTREMLQNEENNYKVKTLYCFENGELKTINENVLDFNYYDNALMFNTVDMIDETVKIEDVSYTSNVKDLFLICLEDENYVLQEGMDTTYRMSVNAGESLSDIVGMEKTDMTYVYDYNYARMYIAGNEVYINPGEELYVAPIENGVIGSFDIISDDAKILRVSDSVLYYGEGMYSNNDFKYCDLYSYSNGKSECLVKDVIPSTIRIYDDGVIIANTGYRSSAGYELTMVDKKGNSNIISDSVTRFVRVDESNLLYISDYDLYRFNGKEKNRVKDDVSAIWTLDSLEASEDFSDIY